MSFFKDLKEDIAQSVNELTESLDENLTVDDEKTKETVPMSELTTDFPPEEPTEEVPELVVENSETEENEIAVAAGRAMLKLQEGDTHHGGCGHCGGDE
mgnify:CR=1 FL=1